MKENGNWTNMQRWHIVVTVPAWFFTKKNSPLWILQLPIVSTAGPETKLDLVTSRVPSLKLTAIAPKNGWLEYYFPIGARPIFRGKLAISFREGIPCIPFSCNPRLGSRIFVQHFIVSPNSCLKKTEGSTPREVTCLNVKNTCVAMDFCFYSKKKEGPLEQANHHLLSHFGPRKRSLNFIFPTKYGIPKSLKG